jgi:A/G-specific adenine glycosylase
VKSQENEKIAKAVQKWYRKHKRKLPWRASRNPYHIWISEIMLQQTQVETVIPYYQRFIKQFPNIMALAHSSLEEVLKVWENMGYYSRARNLHEAAKKISQEMGGDFPKTREAMLALPGIGNYTASAILSFAYHQPLAAIDGNLKRILARLSMIKDPVETPSAKRKIETLAHDLANRIDSADLNQGLMDLGAKVCRPRNPSCLSCPLNPFCRAYKRGLQEKLPLRVGKEPIPHKDFTAGIIQDEQGRLLIIKRPAKGFLGGLWRLPGGERKGRKAIKTTLESIIKSELGIEVCAGKKILSIKHAYSHFRITFHVFRGDLIHPRPKPLEADQWKWCRIQDLKKYPFSKAEHKIIRAVFFKE